MSGAPIVNLKAKKKIKTKKACTHTHREHRVKQKKKQQQHGKKAPFSVIHFTYVSNSKVSCFYQAASIEHVQMEFN